MALQRLVEAFLAMGDSHCPLCPAGLRRGH
jgi:hypothetical protein